jgi:hypothetical protein
VNCQSVFARGAVDLVFNGASIGVDINFRQLLFRSVMRFHPFLPRACHFPQTGAN